jgi:hypothetical protein
MNRGEVVKVLIGVRHRRVRALDDAVRDALQQERAAIEVAQSAQDKLQSAVACEARARDSLRTLTDPGQTFDVSLMLLREHLTAVEKEKVVRQQGEVDQCDAALMQRRRELGERRVERGRNLRKIETLQEDLRRWRDERQREQDDGMDEEAEEAATSRLAMARGAADPSAAADDA